jgi:hypothetical protein
MSEEKEEVYVSPNTAHEDLTAEKCLIIDAKGKVSINKEGPLDSMEEWWFVCYLKELWGEGVILDFDKNEEKIELTSKRVHFSTEIMKTKTKLKEVHLFNGHSYKPDFNVKWNPEYQDVIYSLIGRGKHYTGNKMPFLTCNGMYHTSVFEVKADFTKGDEMQKTNMNLKWVFDRFDTYVQMVKIPKLFKETFTPKGFMDANIYVLKSKRGQSKLKYKPTTCKDYIARMKKVSEGQQTLL